MSLDQIPIGRFSQITRLSKKALRLYDERGILEPSIKDPLTSYRYYSLDQIEKGIKIKILSWIGFSLKELDEYFVAIENENKDKIKSMFDNRLNEIQHEIKNLKKIEEVLSGNYRFEELFAGITEPIIKLIPELRVISKREKGSYENIIYKLINQILSLINNKRNREEHVKILGPPIYICHDKSYKETNADIEITIPVSGRVYIDEGFEVKNLDTCRVISIINKGPYSNLGLGYTKIFDYATKNGITITGPSRQIYLSDPRDKGESELLTEIQLPIED